MWIFLMQREGPGQGMGIIHRQSLQQSTVYNLSTIDRQSTEIKKNLIKKGANTKTD